MRQKTGRTKARAEKVIKDIGRATRRRFSAEEKIRIVLAGLRGEDSIAATAPLPATSRCRRGVPQRLAGPPPQRRRVRRPERHGG